MTTKRSLLGAAATLALAAPSFGQFGNEWLSYSQDASRLPGGATSVSDINTETDMFWGDLDKDGDDDLVVVRKQPFTSAGKRTNLLLMNEGGILVDRTAQWATASDLGGDQGFNTPTNDRDVVFADFDGDGWLDVVTATTLSDGDPKAIGHPRIYMNRGNDGSGNWLGLRHEDSRIPQLYQYTTGNPENPRFCSVAAGDVTGDGRPDLYFGDYDSSGAGGLGQPSNLDMNDRLLINDGNGFFTDQSQSRMTATMLKSAFGMAVEIADMNGDGVNDILKDTALQSPQYVAISYNNPSNEGFFNLFDDFHFNAPYHTDVGDLNNDGRLDAIMSDDAQDRYRLNMGNDAFGRVNWSSAYTYNFLTGSDDGFASNNLIVDLDGDGWNDTLHADIDVDIGGFNRRLHIYHNKGTSVGQLTKLNLVEERENSGNGWIGAKGLTTNDLRGTHDFAVFDLDLDGDKDLIISRSVGTFVWMNNATTTPCGYAKYDVGASAVNTMDLSGGGSTSIGGNASVTATGVPVSAAPQGWILLSAAKANLPLFGGILLVDITQLPQGLTQFPVVAGQMTWAFALPNDPSFIGGKLYWQSAIRNNALPNGFTFSNGLELTICP